ncbi:MAG: hypothetical protein D3909_04500, partial [Candidatus Electrothrix sp. ATG1]|nr:hypothetical protein [Candidatus Electrothrix sp. ATG1]
FQELSNAEGFHLIEHVLLRRRSYNASSKYMPIQVNKPECVEVRDPYSFRFTVILPAWPRRFRDMRFRQFVEKTLRLEAPAHTLVRICWLNYSEMQEFEDVYQTWARELGRHPLDEDVNTDYEQALNNLIDILHSLSSTYPIARLHNCGDTDSNTSPVTLNNSILGTF